MESERISVLVNGKHTPTSICLDGPHLDDLVNEKLSRYRRILEDECPELTISQWLFLRDITGWSYSETFEYGDGTTGLLMSVEEAAIDGLGEKWGIDMYELVETLKSVSYAAQCAVIEVLHCWWASDHGAFDDYETSLISAGAKIQGH